MRGLILVAIAACHSPPHDAGGAHDDAGLDAGCTATGVEGCACAPVGAGQGASLSPSRPLSKLANDPARCRVYGLAVDAVLVFDTRAKTELAAVTIAGSAYDFDVASDGARMVVSHRNGGIDVIDLDLLSVVATLPVPVDPGPIEVTAAGQAYYANFDQFSSVHRLDLSTGSDTVVGDRVAYQADLELSADDTKLFVGDSSSSSSAMVAFDVSSPAFTQIGRTSWDHGFDFSNAARHVFVSHSGNAYFAAHQWRSLDLTSSTGGTRETILAEDDQGVIAIGTAHAFDVSISKPTIAFPMPVVAATFAAGGQEAWIYSAGLVGYVATMDLVGSRPLGAREVDPLPLSAYSISQLVADPAHGALYGRDPDHDAIVVIDGTSLQPVRELRVGTSPSDMSLDADELDVGHDDQQVIARIDLGTRTVSSFVQTPRLPFEIEAAGTKRVITIDSNYDGGPTLVDLEAQTFAPTTQGVNFGALAVTADRSTLFVGESQGSTVFEFAIGTEHLSLLSATTPAMTGGNVRRIVSTTTGATVFYADNALDGTALPASRYMTTEPVLDVSPDNRVAVTQSTVLDVATGALLGLLPMSGPFAISPDSQTLYIFNGGAIHPVALSTFH
jgi:hypothetical protein